MKSFIKQKKVKSILDPWVNIGELLYLTNEVFPAATKLGYVFSKNLYELNEIVSKCFEQKLGDSFELSKSENKQFDLIISNLPVGLLHPIDSPLGKDGSGLTPVDYGYEVILASLPLLNVEGTMICTVGSDFFYKPIAQKLQKLINEKGFSVDAIFGAPVKAINQNASVPFYFLVLKPGKQTDVFIAEIDDNLERQKRILDNYNNQRKSKDISEGILLSLNDISPISNILVERELDILLKRTGLPLAAMNELGKFKPLNQVENDWIIISKIPHKPVEIGRTKENLKENYNFFFEINTEKIKPNYLQNLLNSNLGTKLLKTTSTGVSFGSLNRKALEEMQLPIPALTIQHETLELNRKLKDIENEFSELRLTLWKTPKQVKEIEKKVNQKLKNSNNIEWMEELPFPLASILWGYYSESKTSKKIEYLFLFFEGLCEFLDILVLSALVSNKAFFENTAKHWLKNDEMQNWHIKASFGGWQKLFEKLAKNVRGNYNDKAETEFIQDLFGKPSNNYFEMVTSKSLVNILSQINQLRNNYKGHSGVTSEIQNKKVFGELELAFFDIRDLLVEGFSNVLLLNPVPSTMDWNEELNVFTTTCKILKGTRSKFNQTEIQTNKQISSKKLYLLNENEFTPIEILPFSSNERNTQNGT